PCAGPHVCPLSVHCRLWSRPPMPRYPTFPSLPPLWRSSSSLFFSPSRAPRDLHSFPTRRSSDLYWRGCDLWLVATKGAIPGVIKDRKSTRLNSSHVSSSYAVFCLKKKKVAGGEQFDVCL